MKAVFVKIGKFLLSLVTDADWDGDSGKVFGLVIIACGLIGFFQERPDFQWVILFGAGLMGWAGTPPAPLKQG